MALQIPGSIARSQENAPEAIIRCADRFCAGDGGPFPSGRRLPRPGEASTNKHRATCSACGRPIIVPTVAQE